jgi:hypothetical protein
MAEDMPMSRLTTPSTATLGDRRATSLLGTKRTLSCSSAVISAIRRAVPV